MSNNHEHIDAGRTLPLVFGPISRGMLALYAGASGDHNPVHIDIDFARAAGRKDVFAHGMLSFGVLARFVRQYAGTGRIHAFSARFLAITEVHDVISCSGHVTEWIEIEGEACARLALQVVNQNGVATVTGEAIVSAPSPEEIS